MNSTDIPTKFANPFAYGAAAGNIRAIPNTVTAGLGQASLTLGFPPETFTPVGVGGIPPDGRDVNGVLSRTTAWNRWQAAGGPLLYDAPFATLIGGYPAGATLQIAGSSGAIVTSLVENNMQDPTTIGQTQWLFNFVNALQAWPSTGYYRVGQLVIQTFGGPQVSQATPGAIVTFNFVFPTPFANLCAGISVIDGAGNGITFGAVSNVTRLGGTAYGWGLAAFTNAGAHFVAIGS